MTKPGSCCAKNTAFDGRRLLAFDERLVQAAGGLDRHDFAQRLEGRSQSGCAPRHVWNNAPSALRAADAAQRDRALAVLHRLDGVELRQRPRRPWDRAERLGDRRERRVGVELAGDDQHRVVGLVVQSGRTPAASRMSRSRCRSARRSCGCRSCASRMRRPAIRFHSTRCGLFSPLSYSLRTTVISVSSSLLRTSSSTIRSASIFSAQSRFSAATR